MRNTTLASLIQVRRGLKADLVRDLNPGEFGLTTDTNELYLGNPSNEKLASRSAQNIFPYGNIKVLTEGTNILSNNTRFILNYEYITTNFTDGLIKLYTLGDSEFSNNVFLDSIKLNVRKPFFPMVEYIDDNRTVTLTKDMHYYVGDIVKGTISNVNSCFVCVREHIAISNNIVNDGYSENIKITNWKIIEKTGISIDDNTVFELQDPKYMTIYATNFSNTENKYYFILPQLVDLQMLDTNNYNYPLAELNNHYNINDIIVFQNKCYKCIANGGTTLTLYIQLHDDNIWKQIQNNGLSYILNFDKNLILVDDDFNIIDDNYYEPTFDFSGYTFYYRLFDKDMNVIKPYYQINDSYREDELVQVNPSGIIETTINLARGW